MIEIEKLRALLAEARSWDLPEEACKACQHPACKIARRIDAALAEPVVACNRCARAEEVAKAFVALSEGWLDATRRERDEAREEGEHLRRERDEARAEVERLEREWKIERDFTDEYVKRWRKAEEKAEDAFDALREKIEGRLGIAFERGAEAMREAAARTIECPDPACCNCVHQRLADEVRAVPIPEDKP